MNFDIKNNIVVFYGTVEGLEKLGSDLFSTKKITIISKEKFWDTDKKTNIVVERKYYITDRKGILDESMIDEEVYLLCKLDYRNVISKKATDKKTGEDFRYGVFDFTLLEYEYNLEDLTELLNDHFKIETLSGHSHGDEIGGGRKPKVKRKKDE